MDIKTNAYQYNDIVSSYTYKAPLLYRLMVKLRTILGVFKRLDDFNWKKYTTQYRAQFINVNRRFFTIDFRDVDFKLIDGKIYLINFDGQVAVVDAADGKILNVIPMDEPAGEEVVRASISAAYGQLFIRTTRKLYCVGSPR